MRRPGADGVRFLPVTMDAKLAPVQRTPHAREGNWRAWDLRPKPGAPRVSATYVSIDKTCPASCPFKRSGCYVESGFTRVLGLRLDLDAIGLEPGEVAAAEAKLIDAAFRRGVPQDGARGGRDLRLHVGGETPTPAGAHLLARAVARWGARGGGRAWTYTHRWGQIRREAFGPISTLASVETVEQASAAIARGYVPALVVPTFPAPRAFDVGVPGWRAVPCPAELRPGRVTCASCRLCLDDAGLRQRRTMIAFAVHGGHPAGVGRALAAIAT